MPIERLRPSFSFDEEKIKELKTVVPEVFADGKINWEALKEVLGEYLEDESGEVEHFGLFWPGKKEARRIASIPSKGTLVPAYGEGLKADGKPDTDGVNNSHNIFIEGENLEVLKILQKSYAGRIKMIYIDPPYNTGNDFVYDDDFTEPLDEYLRRTGQIDGEGKPLTTNKRADGRFHSKWLNMIFPRLRLAYNLLSDDGLIFINIDNNESYNLRLILNEIFGEENFIADVIWKHTQQSKNDESYFSRHYNNLIIYSKSEELQKLRFPRTEKNNINYSNPDNDNKGSWRSGDVRSPNYRKTLCFHLKTPSGKIIEPPKNGWRWSEESILEKIKIGEIIFNEDETKIIRKIYLVDQEGRTPENVWIGDEYGTTRTANSELKELFGDDVPFDTPKPTNLIIKILNLIYDEKDFLVLDFFAGSGTTAHAVLKLNEEDNGNRKFVLVQMPEPCDEKSKAIKAGYKNIAEIGKERIRRVAKRLKVKTPSDKLRSQDLGFKSFKLSHSNFREWENSGEKNLTELEDLFKQHVSPTIDGSKEESLIIEIMLLEGFPLDARINRISEFKSNEVKLISSEFYDHQLIVCLDEKIKGNTINELNLGEKDIFICLDTAISDQDKLRLGDKGLIKTI